ncbi:MAG: VOC family protein [Methanobacteriota archaeon]|nr:MAG: VOC family protein [Euryarchaeota archaeon]
MPGIVFLSTMMREEIVDFYTSRLGMKIWIEQEDCTVLEKENLALGFCQRDSADIGGIICYWLDSMEEVDEKHRQLADIAEGPPRENEKYRIYHFFLRDPEGRRLEVQKFLDL